MTSPIHHEWTSRDGLIRLIHGDSREVVPTLGPGDHAPDVLLTDPPWPGVMPEIAWGADQRELIKAVIGLSLPLGITRLILQFAYFSDPRDLAYFVPAILPFVRTVNLRYARPSYHGPMLVDREVAYVFGEVRIPTGSRVLAAEHVVTMKPDPKLAHPCPRPLSAVEFLLRWYGAKSRRVLDPFLGSGTAAVAAYRLGVPFVGVEIHEPFYREAVDRMEAAQRRGRQGALSLDQTEVSTCAS